MQALFNTVLATLNSLVGIFIGGANVIGIFLILIALVGLASNVGSRGIAAKPTSVYLRSLVIGSFLIIAVKLLDVSTLTLFDQESRKVLDYTLLPVPGLNEQSRYMLGVVYAVIATVGFFAFLRGWMMLRGANPSEGVGRAFVFIIAGTMAVNMDVVLRVTATTAAQFSVELADNIRLFIPS